MIHFGFPPFAANFLDDDSFGVHTFDHTYNYLPHLHQRAAHHRVAVFLLQAAASHPHQAAVVSRHHLVAAQFPHRQSALKVLTPYHHPHRHPLLAFLVVVNPVAAHRHP